MNKTHFLNLDGTAAQQNTKVALLEKNSSTLAALKKVLSWQVGGGGDSCAPQNSSTMQALKKKNHGGGGDWCNFTSAQFSIFQGVHVGGFVQIITGQIYWVQKKQTTSKPPPKCGIAMLTPPPPPYPLSNDSLATLSLFSKLLNYLVWAKLFMHGSVTLCWTLLLSWHICKATSLSGCRERFAEIIHMPEADGASKGTTLINMPVKWMAGICLLEDKWHMNKNKEIPREEFIGMKSLQHALPVTTKTAVT